MQGIWSTASQLWGCHCRICLSATNTVARRAASTIARRRHKNLTNEIYTAFYSTVVATAVVVDAGRKNERRRELDRQIAEAKSRLATAMEQSASRDLEHIVSSASTYSDEFFRYVPPGKEAVLVSICNTKTPVLLDRIGARYKRWRDISKVREVHGLKLHVYDGVGTASLATCQNAVASEEGNLAFSQREPVTELQFSMMTDMINDLVDGLLEEAYRETENQAPFARRHPSNPDSAWNAIRRLRSEGYPRYSHPSLDPEGAKKDRLKLDQTNSEIMAGWDIWRRENYVAKICYNLLVSNTPPGIESYNTLMLGFTKLGEHRLADAVAYSFLDKSHLKPTQATLLCLLHHYRLKKDVIGFRRVIRRMTGYDRRGIGLRRREVTWLGYRPPLSVQDWFNHRDVTVKQGYAIELPKFDAPVFEAILEGLIDFNMLGHAARLYVACLREKVAVSYTLVAELLHACINLFDDMATQTLIHGFLAHIDETTSMILGPPTRVRSKIVRRLRLLLNVRSVRSNIASGTAYSRNAVDRHTPSYYYPYNPPERLVEFATALWIHQVQDDLYRMSHILIQVKRTLSQPLSTERLDHTIRLFDKRIANRERDMAKDETIKKIALDHWLHNQLVASIDGRNVAEHPSPSLINDEAFDGYWHEQAPDTVESPASACFAKSRDINACLREALLEALPPTPAITSVYKCISVQGIDDSLILLETFTFVSNQKEIRRAKRDKRCHLHALSLIKKV
ncbi:hypothetical protein B0T17DRAFT_586402 [Bombardia bombarda]|uniref:Pentatricopeptide repeat domain-containing protein n=1 Tax=Bombardia bombarda TaxID=252184 RepID=A0AA39XIN7_9PEZI|nr:hypothetical protein B0T17DRAFT_586402 [Bombardia bombarda]